VHAGCPISILLYISHSRNSMCDVLVKLRSSAEETYTGFCMVV